MGFGCPSPPRRWAGLLGGLLALAALPPLLPPAAVHAIPEADAIRKLQVIPVFLLTNDKGVPLPIPRDKALILPLFLDRAAAERQRDALKKNNPELTVRVQPLPMNVANDRVAEIRKQLKDGYSLEAPIVAVPRDLEQGAAMLRKLGASEEQIRQGLNVPVFFTKPFLTIETPEGVRGVFFFSYDALQKSLQKVPEKGKLTPQVADLTAVLREIIEAKQDTYVFYPTDEYFRLQEQSGRSAVGGPPAPPPAP